MTLAGSGSLVRFALRRDRLWLPMWVLAVTVLVGAQAASSTELYGDPEALAALAATIGANPAVIAMAGPPVGLGTVGGEVVFELATFGPVVVGLMSALLVGRHTRADEESGRLELVLSTAVGRNAPLAAALLVALGANLLTGALAAAALVSFDLPVAGSVAFGASLAAFGMVVAAVTAVAVQVSEHARAATGISVAVIGASAVLRAAGDVGDGTLSWLSPMGWSQATHPYADDRWWPLALSVLATVALSLAAFALVGRRDLGAGFVQPRPGRAQASAALGVPSGLAWRLHRGALVGWAVGLFLLGAAYGSMGDSINDMLADNPELQEWLAGSGSGQFTDAYFATVLVISALTTAGYGVSAMLRLRSEETAGRAEPLLATPVSRRQLVASHLSVALVGSGLLLLLAGAGTGLAYAVVEADWSALGRLSAAAMAYVPAVWLVVAVTAALVGVAPRLAPLAWAYLALCFVVAILADQLQLPDWLTSVSAFDHLPLVPLESVAALPLLVLGALAAGLVAAGLLGFRHRDIATS